MCAYGTEALGVMRIEKGHISGPELNGTTTPRDLGLGGMVSSKKDFVGTCWASAPASSTRTVPALVGFRPVDRSARLRSGAHFRRPQREPDARANDEGYMTSVAYSPSNGHWIGLGLLKRGPQRMGEIVRAYDPVREATRWSRSSRPSSSILKEDASVAEQHSLASALCSWHPPIDARVHHRVRAGNADDGELRRPRK